ncbi:MAG: sel1 repeat family protein, partial [Bacteroidaceae bacterium]|nr:sel1 repeat family protein [Bacteroidaceae bacterium]
RQGNVLFSSSDIMETRVSDKPDSIEESRNIEKKESLIVETTMDSVLMAQCAFEHEKGIVYYNQKRYKNAVMIFAELVQYKYPPALYYVGKCYRDGTGLAKNDKLALSFMLEAAKHNEPRAQYEFAMAIYEGEIVKRDESKAFEWLRLAVANEEPRAMFEMACRCFEGQGVEQDSVAGRELLEKSARHELPEAMYMHGKQLIAEGSDGIKYIRNAAEKYCMDAVLYMLDYEERAGNYQEAFKYAKRLSMAGYHEGTKRMADYYLEGKGTRRDKRTAKDLYRDAATAGNKEALEKLRSL